MQTRIRDRLERFFRGKSFPSKPPLTDRLDKDRLITLTKQLKSQNPMERKSAERELMDRGQEAKPYLEQLLSERKLDGDANLTAVRILGGLEGPAAVRPPYRVTNDSSGPKIEVDPAILRALSESLRRSSNPKLRKHITNVLEKLKTRPSI